MARSNYKRFFLTYDDMLYFYNNKVLDNKTFYPQSDREKVINPLNCDA